MDTFLGIGIGLFIVITGLVLPWINRYQTRKLKDEINRLQEVIALLSSSQEGSQKPSPTSESVSNSKEQANDVKPETINNHEDAWQGESETKDNLETGSAPSNQKHSVGFEQQFGARLPVWIGGIALALAGFFLVKYSLDNNLLSPSVRISIGTIFGFGLLYAANKIRNKQDFSSGIRIAQSLSGAGIAVLYVVSYASVRLYALFPSIVGFIAMAAVTATALVLSLRHGPPIAMLGMAGGFLTPALLSTGSGDVFSLFIYLYFTASGLLIVIRKSNWWWLSIPTILGALLWVIVWLFTRYTPSDSLCLGLFLAAISATIVSVSGRQYAEDGGGSRLGAFKLTSILNYIALAGTLMLMGLIAGKAGFGWMEWGLFALLALGSIGLAFFNDRLYGFVPWVSMAVSAVMLGNWDTTDPIVFINVLFLFAIIYTVSSYFLMWRAYWPLAWAGLHAATMLSYYLLAWFKLQTFDLTIPTGVWGVMALLLAIESTILAFKISKCLAHNQHRDHILTVFVVAATSFVTIALFIELDREFLSVAIAVQMAALAWINRRVSVNALRPLTTTLSLVFALLLMPQILLMFQLTAYSLVEAKLYLQSTVPIVDWPVFQLGVPAAMFLLSSWWLRQKQEDRVVEAFEISAIALIAVMGYYVTRNSFHTDQNVLFIRAGFLERGIITNILILYGLLCCWAGIRFYRRAISWSGVVLVGIGLFRIGYFDLLVYNPLWNNQRIQGIVLFNTLLLPFGFPLLWCWYFLKILVRLQKQNWLRYIGGFSLVLLFSIVSLNVRFYFHGSILNLGVTSNAEIYSYSVTWLVLGIGLLFAGILKQDKMLRYASLSVILLTIGKVFLYDASELEGLYRVFSFFGLGLSLIGLSYFYTRFVFGKRPNSSELI